MRHRLRPATPDDREALLAIYASTRADELALTDWSATQCRAFVEMQFDAQWRHYSLHYPQSICQLIVLNTASASGTSAQQVLGRLWVDRSNRRLHVLDITLLPESRGRGLGSQLLRELMTEADDRATALTVSVEVHNPARHLYERLGFLAQGEAQGIYQRMAWRPATRQATEHQECLP